MASPPPSRVTRRSSRVTSGEAPATATARARRGSASSVGVSNDGGANPGTGVRGGAKRRRVEQPTSPVSADADTGILISSSKPMTAAATARAARTRAGASPETAPSKAQPRSSPRASGRSTDVAPTASAEAARTTSPSRRRSSRALAPSVAPTEGAPASPGRDAAADASEMRPSGARARGTPRMRAGARAMATSPEANQAKETELDLDAVDAVDGTATVPVPSLIYGGARAWGPAGDADAELKNAYDSVNLVRSDLIREFENRGVRVAQLERENNYQKNALVEAETRMTLAESEKSKWFDAVTELKRQRDARAAEAREERAEAERDAETRVRRAAALEGELATANARLARADEETKRLKARNDALEARETAFSENQHPEKSEKSEDAAAQRLARRLAESARDAAESRAAAAAAAAEAREARLECRQAALRREELEQRLEHAERALRDAEGLVGDAEAAVALARADAEAARAASASDPNEGGGASRIAELETALAALRGAAAQDAAAVAAARRANVDVATVAAAEERASAERARAERAEARLASLEAAAGAEEASRDVVAGEAERWRAALARVPGASSPAGLADAVVRLEEELAAALGGGGEAAAAAAAAAATAAAAARRAEEAEAALSAAKANEDEAIGALARAERKVDLLTREKESLRRVVKSYDDEASKHAAAPGPPAKQSPAPAPAPALSPFGAGSREPSAPETARRAEADASLRAAHERVSELEAELEAASRDGAAARAALAEGKALAASAAAAAAAAEGRAEALERETRALERRLSARKDLGDLSGDLGAEARRAVVPGVGLGIVSLEKPVIPDVTKVLHFKRNPEVVANETAAARELATCRSECAALRETVARLSGERPPLRAPDSTPYDSTRVPFGGLATPGGAMGVSTLSTPLGTPLVTPGGGSAVADAELTVARRRAADLEKREQRLMTAFKKQIYVFRESVRLLFGYKVDMSVDESAPGANACVATLRSQFTLHADDEDERHVLRFAVEPARVGGAAGAAAAHDEGSVALLATPAAETEKVRRMADTFVGKCGSVPAFLANLTMELFNESEMRGTR